MDKAGIDNELQWSTASGGCSAYFLTAVIATVMLLAPAASQSVTAATADSAPMPFAGFTFIEDDADARSLYPITMQLTEPASAQYLDLNKLLLARLERHPLLRTRVTTALVDRKIHALNLSFVLVQETTETQRIGGKYYAIAVLQADILAFDRESHSVVASYPLRLRVVDAFDEVPTRDTFKALVLSAYTSTDANTNIFDLWLTRLETLHFRSGATKFLGVKEVILTSEAQAVIAGSKHEPNAIRKQIANEFEVAVAEGCNVPMVPNSLGKAGETIALRFVDGVSEKLKFEKPDYEMTLIVRDFVSTEVDQLNYIQNVYRVKATVAIKEPAGDHTFVEENVYDTMIVTRPKQLGLEIEQWSQYEKTLGGLLNSLGKNFLHPDKAWLKDHASRSLDARPGFQSVSSLMAQLQ